MTSLNEKVGVEIRLLGYKNFIKQLRDTQKLLNKISKSYTVRVNIVTKGLAPLQNALGMRNGRGRQLRVTADMAPVKKSISQLKNEKIPVKLTADQKSLNAIKGQVQSATKGATVTTALGGSFGDNTFARTGMGRLANIGAGLQSLNNGLARIFNNPISTIFRGSLYQAGFGLMNTAFEGLSKSRERFDTMKTYPKMMQEIGFSLEDSAKSIDTLDKSVRGLPTSLNDITDFAKRFATTTGDINKGTKIAIATNNAFLASSSTDTQKYQGMMQLQDVLAGKKLTSREWMSLNASMSPAMRQISKRLGYTAHSQFLQDLYANRIGNEEFIQALIDTGTGNGALVSMANISKTTLGGVISNIKIAFARLGENILKGLDTGLQSATGKGLIETLRGIIDRIDDLGDRIVAWVNKNPQKVKKWVDNIRSFDFEGMLSGLAKGLEGVLTILTGILKIIPANLLGSLMVFGPLLTGIGGMFGSVIRGIGRFADIRGKDTEKKMGHIRKFFRHSKDVAKEASEASKAVTPAATSAPSKLNKLFNVLKGTLMGAGIVVVSAGAIAAVVGAITGIMVMFRTISKVSQDINWKVVGLTLANMVATMFVVQKLAIVLSTSGIGGLVATAIGGGIIAIVGTITAIIAGFAALDTWLLKKASENIKSLVANMGEVTDDLRRFNVSDLKDSVSKIGAIIKSINKISGIAVGNGFGPILGWFKKVSSSNFKAVAENTKDTLGAMADIAKNVSAIKLPKDTSLEGVKNLLTWMSDFYKLFSDDEYKYVYDLSLADTGTVGKGESGNLSAIASNFASTLEQLISIADSMQKIGGNKFIGNDANFAKVKTSVSKLVSSLVAIYDEFDKKFTLGFLDSVGSGSKKKTSNLSAIIENLKSTLVSIMDIVGTLKNIADDKFLANGKNLIKTRMIIKMVAMTLGGIFNEFDNYFNYGHGDNTGKLTKKNTSMLSEAITNMQTTMESASKIVSTAKSMDSNINSLKKGKDGKFAVATQLKDLISQLTGSLGGAKGAATMTIFTNAFSLLVNSINSLAQNKGLGSISQALKDIGSQLNQLVKDFNNFFSTMGTKFKLAGRAWRTMLLLGFNGQSISESVTTMLANIFSARNYYLNGYSTGASYRNGVQAALNATRTITLFGRQIPVPGFAKGGKIFKPRGTDTVPAMLTPGEFVMRKSAVSKFGEAFMARINRLDIPGAIQALQAKAGAKLVPSSTIINKTTNNNNNAKLTQNIYSNNPNYSYRVANRYVRAL